jgi:hypothetical protein
LILLIKSKINDTINKNNIFKGKERENKKKGAVKNKNIIKTKRLFLIFK